MNNVFFNYQNVIYTIETKVYGKGESGRQLSLMAVSVSHHFHFQSLPLNCYTINPLLNKSENKFEKLSTNECYETRLCQQACLRPL